MIRWNKSNWFSNTGIDLPDVLTTSKYFDTSCQSIAEKKDWFH